MILSTHAIAGAAIATLLPNNPGLAFLAGFISHFLLDAIPHWEYNLSSATEDKKHPLNSTISFNKEFAIDLVKTGSDFTLGIFISLLFFSNSLWPVSWTILWGAIGGVAPDFLQLVYWKLRVPPLTWLQRFHIWIHAKKKLNDRPALGISLQVALVLAIILLFA